eukprot:CAMPEP_0116888388 /NCGR_PEP_ID=MMETSP0463-20121206/23378_1 /TAXON_ID=181622 /ORGANISM="Strombidinopsis sp, Strain SopsisLIS2011" /LENGTH=48 /DNA_ID= /DNA_START= /DNA_END= /DNA_ORIENTATION=
MNSPLADVQSLESQNTNEDTGGKQISNGESDQKLSTIVKPSRRRFRDQ